MLTATLARAEDVPEQGGSDPAAMDLSDEDRAYIEQVRQLGWQSEGEGELGARAVIQIPPQHSFLGGADAARYLELNGNISSHEELGLIGPNSEEWFAVYFFDDIGYVKDDDKDDLDADEMLATIREQMAAGNEVRSERGLSTFELDGWQIPPTYNDELNTLEWATRFVVDGRTTVNFKTKVLGRKGVMRVVLVTGPERLPTAIPEFRRMMEDFRFVDGERYADYVSGDKIAQYGLAALVVGAGAAAAAKTGLLAGLFLFLKKGWKLVAAAVVAVGIGLRRLFSGGERVRDDEPVA